MELLNVPDEDQDEGEVLLGQDGAEGAPVPGYSTVGAGPSNTAQARTSGQGAPIHTESGTALEAEAAIKNLMTTVVEMDAVTMDCVRESREQVTSANFVNRDLLGQIIHLRQVANAQMVYSDSTGRTEWSCAAPGIDEVVVKRTELDNMKVYLTLNFLHCTSDLSALPSR